jgi:two-component sensor histidine kinase
MGELANSSVTNGNIALPALEELRRIQIEQTEGRHVVKTVLDAVPLPLYATDADGFLTYYNPAAVAFWGTKPDRRSQRWCGSWKLLTAAGEPIPYDACPMAVALREKRALRGPEAIAERPDGTRVAFMPHPTPIFGTDGKLVGGVNVLFDLTEVKRAEAKQKALIDELNHRVKNTLATVQSLAAQSFRNTAPGDGAKAAFEARLLALSKTHDRLTRECWEWADLKAIVSDVVAPYRGEQVHLDGGPVRLPSKPALTLSMVLHELATNAAKYGSLSVPEGQLSISWRAFQKHDGQVLKIEWHETGGPAVSPPVHKGFGNKLIERSIKQDLGGTAETVFDPAGLRYTCEMALSK